MPKKNVSYLKKIIEKKRKSLNIAKINIEKNMVKKKVLEKDLAILYSELLSGIPDYKEPKKSKKK